MARGEFGSPLGTSIQGRLFRRRCFTIYYFRYIVVLGVYQPRNDTSIDVLNLGVGAAYINYLNIAHGYLVDYMKTNCIGDEDL